MFALNPLIKFASNGIDALVVTRLRSRLDKHSLQERTDPGMRVRRLGRLRTPAQLAAELQPVLDSGIDVEIRWIDGDTEIGDDMRFVAQDYALAVCSPRYLRALGGELSKESAATATAVNALNGPGTWQRWLVRAFAGQVARQDTIDLQTTSLCVQAALGGVAIAMAHGSLVQRELAEGTLVLANRTSLPLQERYVAIRRRVTQQDIFEDFARWVGQNMTLYRSTLRVG